MKNHLLKILIDQNNFEYSQQQNEIKEQPIEEEEYTLFLPTFS